MSPSFCMGMPPRVILLLSLELVSNRPHSPSRCIPIQRSHRRTRERESDAAHVRPIRNLLAVALEAIRSSPGEVEPLNWAHVDTSTEASEPPHSVRQRAQSLE